jgi:hypothetical protein
VKKQTLPAGLPVANYSEEVAKIRADLSPRPYTDVPAPPGPLGWALRIKERQRRGERLPIYSIEAANAVLNQEPEWLREPGQDEQES